MLRSARDVIAAGDESLVVDFAVEARQQIQALTVDFEAAKQFLREKAAEKVASTKEPRAQIRGSLGTASVNFPRPQPIVKRDVNPLAFKHMLGSDLWHLFFRKKVVVEVVADAEDRLKELLPAQRNLISNLIEIVESTPRVTIS